MGNLCHRVCRALHQIPVPAVLNSLRGLRSSYHASLYSLLLGYSCSSTRTKQKMTNSSWRNSRNKQQMAKPARSRVMIRVRMTSTLLTRAFNPQQQTRCQSASACQVPAVKTQDHLHFSRQDPECPNRSDRPNPEIPDL